MNIKKTRKGVLRRACSAMLIVPLLVSAMLMPIEALTPHGNGVSFRNSYWTNNLDYTFSEAYKTSVWYENFSALSLSDNHRNNVIRIALSQLGYHEGNSAEDFDGKNQNGTKNYIEYARLVCPWYSNNAYEWCACFVNWCLSQADVDYASGEISCWKWATWLKENKLFRDSAAYGGSYNPQTADFIFFCWDGVNTTANHIGFVLYTTPTHVYTVEGNTSDRVAIRSYKKSDPCIIGYGTPDYKLGNERTISYVPTNERHPGLYMVNNTSGGSSVRLYSSNSLSATYRTLPNGTMVTVPKRVTTSDMWVPVQYRDVEGYILPTSTTTVSLLSPATYSLVYDANGGENAPATQTNFCYEKETVSTIAPKKEQAEFLGWAYEVNAQTPILKAGDLVSLEQEVTTLYAVWKELPVETETTVHGGTEQESPEHDETTDKKDNSNTEEATTIESDMESMPALITTTATPENLTTVTGGSNLPTSTGCGAVIASLTSVFVPASLAALLLWRKKRSKDSKDENS